MKNLLFLLFAFLLGYHQVEAQLSISNPNCSSIVAFSTNTEYQLSIENNIWVLEREIAANIWSQKVKETIKAKHVAFQNLAAGRYRISLVERNGNNRSMVVFRSEAVTIGACTTPLPLGDIIVYPNPAKSSLTVKLDPNSKAALRIYHATGVEIVYIPEVSSIQNIDISALKNGIYLIYAEIDGQKILVNKILIINE